MSVEEHKDLIRRFVETVWNGKHVDALDQFYASNYTKNGEAFTTEANKEHLQQLLANLPDLHRTIEDIVAEGDKVAFRWVIRSTNQATRKQQIYRGITFMRIADDKIVEDWYNAETLED